MKNHLQVIVLFIVSFLMCSQTSFAQSVSISGPNVVEVGIAANFTATFDAAGDTTIQIVSYTFNVPWIGTSGGSSGIVGSINGDSNSNLLTINTNQTSVTVPVVWGDFYNTITTDKIFVTVYYNKGKSTESRNNYTETTIKRVCEPQFSGQLSIQKCCTKAVVFSAYACDGDDFDWTTTAGATINSGNGTNTISVTPSVGTGFTLSCTVRRNSGLTSYYRSGSIYIARYDPVTPAITAQNYFCVDSVYSMCVPEICGMTGASWSVPSSLQLLGGQGTKCISVTPNTSIPWGSTDSITAKAIMNGGCIASSSPQHLFKIYGSETPPIPEGYITLELSGGDPCHDPVYEVIWHTATPYVNGITRVSPGIVLGGTHPHGGSGGVKPQIKISVCYINLCSGKSSCKYFWIDRPYPCYEGDLVMPPVDLKADTTKDKKLFKAQVTKLNTSKTGFTVYPNPSDGVFIISSTETISDQILIYDYSGQVVKTISIESPTNETQLELSDLAKGSYILQARSENKTFTQKIIIK